MLPKFSDVKLYALGLLEPVIVPLFHALWCHARDTHKANYFLGHRILQCPFDLQLYQELIYREKPAFVLQTRIFGGGSLVYFASLLDLMGAPPSALVIGVDIILSDEAKKISHPRIRMIEGGSTDQSTVEKIKAILPPGNGLVILDSDHSQKHVAGELEIYPQFVGVGSYLVVEDTNVNGNPVFPGHGPGPY